MNAVLAAVVPHREAPHRLRLLFCHGPPGGIPPPPNMSDTLTFSASSTCPPEPHIGGGAVDGGAPGHRALQRELALFKCRLDNGPTVYSSGAPRDRQNPTSAGARSMAVPAHLGTGHCSVTLHCSIVAQITAQMLNSQVRPLAHVGTALSDVKRPIESFIKAQVCEQGQLHSGRYEHAGATNNLLLLGGCARCHQDGKAAPQTQTFP